MPETPHYAFKYTLSPDTEIRATWTQELIGWAKHNCVWYALKHETGDNGKLHLHFAFVIEIQTSSNHAGAKTGSNVKRTIMNACPNLKEYLMDNPSRYAVSCPPLHSDEWITTYMQKEGSLMYHQLPSDHLELRPYFSDLQANKVNNPQYEKWYKMYEKDRRPTPATLESIWTFFGDYMYKRDASESIKIVEDPRILMNRVRAFKSYMNMEVPEMPSSITGVKPIKYEAARFCPRCMERDRDAPNILGYREQFCPACKNY